MVLYLIFSMYLTVNPFYMGGSAFEVQQTDELKCAPSAMVSNMSFADQVDLMYPVWVATSSRDESALIPYLASEHSLIREAAWRGLSNMTLENPQVLFEYAMNDTLSIRWYTLSNHPVLSEHLRILEDLFDESDDADRRGILLVLGQKGDLLTVDKLIEVASQDLDVLTSAALGLALNRWYTRFADVSIDGNLLIRKSRESKDAMEQVSWLYVWYRSLQRVPSTSELDLLASFANDHFAEAHGLLRQYFIAILGRSGHSILPDLILASGVDALSSLEGVEFAKVLSRYSAHPSFNQLVVSLMNSEHTYVRIETAQSIASLGSAPGLAVAESLHIALEQAGPFEKLALIRALHAWWPNQWVSAFDALHDYSEVHVQLTNEYLELAKMIESHEAFKSRLLRLASHAHPRVVSWVVSQATALVMLNPQNEILKQEIRVLLTKTAEHPSDLVATSLFTSNQAMNWIETDADSQLRSKIELGRTISEFDRVWYMPTSEAVKAVGAHPMWVLHTDLGDISMRLDTRRSPWTVTRFRDYATAGWYEGTPFHRVVSNFVVQSGAVWREDVPNEDVLLIPTEATEGDFSRGAVGIASAGRDTETTQFFMMHMWAPHLNGGYTNFGVVTEGLDIIDRLTQGTMVTGSSFHLCE
jgi:cyclophilin family peptidyl-prolyl cis-trans isomerase